MLYALLAYHDEKHVQSMTPEEDAALMADLLRIHDKLNADGRLGPAARLGATTRAVSVSGPGRGVVTDGPYVETKEHMLGFYVVDCESREAAVQIAQDLNATNPGASYEVRPIVFYTPNTAFPLTDFGLADVAP
jgi:hypothetical protein